MNFAFECHVRQRPVPTLISPKLAGFNHLVLVLVNQRGSPGFVPLSLASLRFPPVHLSGPEVPCHVRSKYSIR